MQHAPHPDRHADIITPWAVTPGTSSVRRAFSWHGALQKTCFRPDGSPHWTPKGSKLFWNQEGWPPEGIRIARREYAWQLVVRSCSPQWIGTARSPGKIALGPSLRADGGMMRSIHISGSVE